jgi:hypothetical protein
VLVAHDTETMRFQNVRALVDQGLQDAGRGVDAQIPRLPGA